MEPKGLVGLRTCTKEDFVGIEHVYDAKNEGVGEGTLICPEDMEKLKLQGSIANMKDRIHFSMAITECNPNTFNGTCETDERKLRKKYSDLLIQLNVVSESFDTHNDLKKVDQFGFVVAPSM